MAEVIRDARQEVRYTLDADSVRTAILEYLEENHGASFTEDTSIDFLGGGAARVSTAFSAEQVSA